MVLPGASEASSAAPSKALSGTATISAGERGIRAAVAAPAGDAHAPGLDLGRHGIGGGAGDDEHRQGGRMVVALHEGQPGDDLGCALEFERVPPGAGMGRGEGRHEAQIASQFRHRGDDAGGAHMGMNGTVKPKWKRALSRIAASPADRSAWTEKGAWTWVKVAMITRQMLSTVSSGRMP